MIYLDQAATSLVKPPEVAEAVLYAMQHCASVGRSGHSYAMLAAETVYETRRTASELFEALPEQIVFTIHATHGLNMAIQSVVKPGDSVVISGFEHNAVLRPLTAIGADIQIAGSELFHPSETLNAFDCAIHKNTKAVICTHVSNAFGYILPVQEIADLCFERGVPFILDASQSAGLLPVSLKKLNAAFIAMPGHKSLYGPQGTGLLICGQTPKPLFYGGTGSVSQSSQMPAYLPDIAEAGTHNVPGIAGLKKGLEFIQEKGLSFLLSHETALMQDLYENLAHRSDLRCYYDRHGRQSGVLSIGFDHHDCEWIAEKLSEHDIAVRAGLHCAPLAHRSAGTLESGTIRVSYSAFNRKEDNLVFVSILSDILDG